MKFIVNNNVLSSVIKVVEQLKKPESKVVLALGGGDEGANVACALRITTDAEQANYNFLAKKPEDWDGSAIITPVDASNFCTAVKSVLAFNEDVYLELSGTILEIGILGKAKTSLPIESQIPQEITPLQFLYLFEIGGTELSNLLSKGCAFTSEAVDEKGCHNAILKLMPKTDEVKACSTDGYIIGVTKVKANFVKATDEKSKAKVEALENALSEYCKAHSEQDKDNFNVIIPREAVQHLGRFIEGQQKVIVYVDARFVHVAIGGRTMMYTIKQAGSQVANVDSVFESYIVSDEKAKFCADSQVLRNTISFINTNNALVEDKDKKYTLLPIKEGEVLVAKSGIADKVESVIKASDIKGEQLVAFNGKLVESALSALNKGNVVMYAGTRHIALFNGTIDKVDFDSFVFIFQVNVAKIKESEEAAESDAVEESAE